MAKMEVIKKAASSVNTSSLGVLNKGSTPNGEANVTSIKTNDLILNKGGQRTSVFGDFTNKLQSLGILDENGKGRMAAFKKLAEENFLSTKEDSWKYHKE